MADKRVEKSGDGKFFAVRDLPEQTRKKIKHYAVENNLTMGQAIERLVEGYYGTEKDRELLRVFFRMYGRVMDEDLLGARKAAEQAEQLILDDSRRFELLVLMSPGTGTPVEPARAEKTLRLMRTQNWSTLGPQEVVEAYVMAYYILHDFETAAHLLHSNHALRRNRSIEETAAALEYAWQQSPRRVDEQPEFWPPRQLSATSCSVTVRYGGKGYPDMPQDIDARSYEHFLLHVDGDPGGDEQSDHWAIVSPGTQVLGRVADDEASK